MIKKGEFPLTKKGCTFNVKNNFENIIFTSETVDRVNFKSISLFMGSWFIVDTDYKATRKMEKRLFPISSVPTTLRPFLFLMHLAFLKMLKSETKI